MALVDQLMGKPMEAVAPLAGAPETYQKAVQTSYDIAQNQERLRIADEQLKLQQDQNKMEYLAKGISALSALSKAKGSTKRIIGQTMFAYFKNGGLELPQSSQDLLLAENDYAKRISDVVSDMNKRGITDPQSRIAFLQDTIGADPDQIETQIKAEETKLKLSAQLSNQIALEGVKDVYKSGLKTKELEAEREKENRQVVQKVLENADIPPAFILRYQRNPMFPQLLQGYSNQIGTEARQLRTRVSGLEGVSPKGVAAIEETLKGAEQAYISGDVERAAELKNRALMEERLLQANKENPEKADKLLSSIKQAGDIFDKSIGQEAKDRIGYLNQIISLANDPNARKNPFSGQLALNGFAKVADPRTGVRDAEYNRIAKASGTTLESFKQIWGQMVNGRPLTEVQWENLNKVAKAVQDAERKEYDKKFENFSKVTRKAGLSQADTNIFSLRFEKPTFGIKGEKKPEEEQKQKTSKGKPSPELVLKSKGKFPNDWKQRLKGIGYDIEGLE